MPDLSSKMSDFFSEMSEIFSEMPDFFSEMSDFFSEPQYFLRRFSVLTLKSRRGMFLCCDHWHVAVLVLFVVKREIIGFHPSFSRHGITQASSVLLIWLNENVLYSPSRAYACAHSDKSFRFFTVTSVTTIDSALIYNNMYLSPRTKQQYYAITDMV